MQVEQEVVDSRVQRLREQAKTVDNRRRELAALVQDQGAQQWSAATPVGAYVSTLRAALEGVQARLGAMQEALEAHADNLEGSASSMTQQDEVVADSLAALASRAGY
ncbi:hypothetical protein [Cellulomonas soli]